MSEERDILIEKQVTSLEPSKQLKELEVKQDSLWYWNIYITSKPYLSGGKQFEDELATDGTYIQYSVSAFTVAELGEMLPDWADFTQKHYNSTSKETWYRCYVKAGITSIDDFKEADARAKMLIWLIENKLVEAKKEDV